MIILDLLDGLLFLHLLLDNSLLLLALAYFDDPLHEFLLLLIDLCFLLLLLTETSLHCLAHQFLFRTLLCLNHFPGHL